MVNNNSSAIEFQSTRPRGARHFIAVSIEHHIPVSIHAPTWGATRALGFYRQADTVSIHAPTWGATGDFVTVKGRYMFQSTRPRGARPSLSALQGTTVNVSIHAPTWGATSMTRPRANCISGFNPRAHVGRDDTLHYVRTKTERFNPRAHVGRDYMKVKFKD